MPTYLDFLQDTLDYMLGQKPESSDAAGADNERIMKKADGKVAVNQAIDYYAQLNQSRFEQEFTYVFDSDVSIFKLPESIAKVKAIVNSDGKWEIIGETSDLRSTIRKVSSDRIYNSDGWSRGDTLEMLVIKYPPKIVSDYDLIEFPRGYMRMLALKVKQIAFNTAGKAMSDYEIMELQREEARWIKDIGKINSVGYFSFKGKKYGRRSR